MSPIGKKPVEVDKLALLALVRAAIGGLTQRGDSIDVPRACDDRWLRRYITRLHQRGPARYSVQARTLVLTVTRTNDSTKDATHVQED